MPPVTTISHAHPWNKDRHADAIIQMQSVTVVEEWRSAQHRTKSWKGCVEQIRQSKSLVARSFLRVVKPKHTLHKLARN